MNDMLTEMLAIEEQVWAALESGDAVADQQLLSPDFLGVYPSGFSGRDGHAAQLVDGPSISSHQITDARLMHLGPETVLLAYRADFCRKPDSPDETMYVSSIWEQTESGWINIFSQDTMAD